MNLICAKNADDLGEQIDHWCRAFIEAQTERMRADGVAEDDIAAIAEMQRAAFRQFKRDAADAVRDIATEVKALGL